MKAKAKFKFPPKGVTPMVDSELGQQKKAAKKKKKK